MSRMPDVPLMQGKLVTDTDLPIMGPPLMTSVMSSGRPPAASMRRSAGVPKRTRKFDGILTDLPVTVTIRSIKGLFFCTAS